MPDQPSRYTIHVINDPPATHLAHELVSVLAAWGVLDQALAEASRATAVGGGASAGALDQANVEGALI